MTPLISKWHFHSPWRLWTQDPRRASVAIGADVLVHALSAVLPADFPATDVCLSDALPFEGDRLYLPTPAGSPAAFEGPDGQPMQAASWQDVRYVAGQAVAVCRAPAAGGLYLVVEAPDEAVAAWDDAFQRLGLTGIGARRSWGWGQFTPTPLVPLSSLAGADGRALAEGLAAVGDGPRRLLSTVPWPESPFPALSGSVVRPVWRGLAGHPEGARPYLGAGSVLPAGTYPIGHLKTGSIDGLLWG